MKVKSDLLSNLCSDWPTKRTYLLEKIQSGCGVCLVGVGNYVSLSPNLNLNSDFERLLIEEKLGQNGTLTFN